jgi:hypothetical protein
MKMTGIFQRARSELSPSAKWTCILALPAVVLVVLISAMMGGIHRHGGLPLTVAVAPYLAFDHLFQIHLLTTFVAYFFVIVIEWTYLFIIIFMVRLVLPPLLRIFTGQ